jgi:hypothetical protein
MHLREHKRMLRIEADGVKCFRVADQLTKALVNTFRAETTSFQAHHPMALDLLLDIVAHENNGETTYTKLEKTVQHFDSLVGIKCILSITMSRSRSAKQQTC